MALQPHQPLVLERLEGRATPAVTSALQPDGTLLIRLDAADAVSLTVAAGFVRVNGADPDTGAAPAAAVTAVAVTGGPGDNVADLSAVVPAAFPNLTAVGLDGGGGRDQFRGPDRDQVWLLAGADAGQILGGGGPGSPVFTFAAVEDLAGGTGSDAFVVADGATLSGRIDAGPGADALDFGDSAAPVDVTLLSAAADGFAGTVAPIGGGFAGIDRVVGGTAADRLTGLAAGGVWVFSESSTYTSGPTALGFAGFEEYVGGGGSDTFELAGDATGSVAGALSGAGGDDRFDFLDGVVLTGILDGGPGLDTLSFVRYGAGVDVVTTATGPDGSDGSEPTAFSGGGFRGIDLFEGLPPPPGSPPPPPPPPPPSPVPTPTPTPVPTPAPSPFVADRPPLVIGSGPGSPAGVRVYDPETGAVRYHITPYDASFTGGVRVAVGDVNGDGVPDVVTGAGDGGGPRVRVFDGRTGEPLPGRLGDFLAFDADFRGGVFVATGDVDGDGYADVVVGAGAGGGPHVRVFSGTDGRPLLGFYAFDAAFRGGVRVAAGDVDGDGRAEVVAAAGPGGGPHVAVFDGTTGRPLAAFFAYDPRFAGGVSVAAGDLDGDGVAEVVTGPGAGGGPDVRAFDPRGRVKARIAAYVGGFRGGVAVAVADLVGDARGEVITTRLDAGEPDFRVFGGPSWAAADGPTGPLGALGGVYVG